MVKQSFLRLLTYIQSPALFHFGHDGRQTVFHATHGRHQRYHDLAVIRVENLVSFQSDQAAHHTDIDACVVMVFWRSPSAYDFPYGLDTIFMGISPQNDESRPVTPSHGPEPEKVRIILLVGQALKKLVGLSDVERVAVAQPPRFPVLLHLLLVSGKIHIPVLLLRLTAFSTVRLVVQIRVQRDKAHGLY